ncbi:ATP-dependent DNA ligase [Nocardia gipuzkoensis]
MLAVPGSPPGTEAWTVELKFDGMRLISVCIDGRCRLYSRTRRGVTQSFPEVAERIIAALEGRQGILDGELVAVNPFDGRHSFGRLQRRIHLARPTREQMRQTVVEYCAFDLLALDHETTMALPYHQRRDLLEALPLDGAGLRVVPVWPGVEGQRVLDAIADAGLEGIVSKKIDSAYRPGRSRAWVKSAVRRSGDALILGWIPGTGSRTSTLGALILGGRNTVGDLVYLGCVGTGFDERERRALRRALDELAAPAPILTGSIPHDVLTNARFVEPILVADVAYREVSADGVLRHPSFRGIKTDIDSADVGLPD